VDPGKKGQVLERRGRFVEEVGRRAAALVVVTTVFMPAAAGVLVPMPFIPTS
jgi:hypothetical protein